VGGKKRGGSGGKRKVVYVDMDGVLVDFPSGLACIRDDVRAQCAGHEDDIPDVFAQMEPMPGAVEAFKELAERIDVYILSTAPWANPSAWSDKLDWVRRHLGAGPGDPAYKRLIITHHKDLNRGDFLIDDRCRRGVKRFKGEVIRFGSKKYPDWPAVMRRMREVDPKE